MDFSIAILLLIMLIAFCLPLSIKLFIKFAKPNSAVKVEASAREIYMLTTLINAILDENLNFSDYRPTVKDMAKEYKKELEKKDNVNVRVGGNEEGGENVIKLRAVGTEP